MLDIVPDVIETQPDHGEVRPMAALLSVPVTPANELNATVTVAASYTSTPNGDSDADVDADVDFDC